MRYKLDRIGLFLLLSGKTQKELAKELGISHHSVGKYINQNRGKRIDYLTLKAICEYFGVPEKAFLDEEVTLKIKNGKISVL